MDDGDVQVHVLSFEGPDPYSRAGGIASRVTGLARALAAGGFETHLWFVGDPDAPGHDRERGVHLHRWCQWISRNCPVGVYDGEDAKRTDYASSLPAFLVCDMIVPHLAAEGARVIVLAEEWHTVDAVLHLDALLRARGLRERVEILWNANNTFGFSRIPWERLRRAAVITTVSVYMKALMKDVAPAAEVVPNGLSPDAYEAPEPKALRRFRELTRARLPLAKVGRWDPSKRWLAAVEVAAALNGRGERPLLLARGGVEDHGRTVLGRARELGLRVVERTQPDPGPSGLLECLEGVGEADVVSLRASLAPSACRLLFRGSASVLADSAHEPFGLVGLEAMAVGGLACTGGTGEDYADPGRNALVFRDEEPGEIAAVLGHLRRWPEAERALRTRGRETAVGYAWERVILERLLPLALDGHAPAEGAVATTRSHERKSVRHGAGTRPSRRRRREAGEPSSGACPGATVEAT